MTSLPSNQGNSAPALSLAADHYNRYPGEVVTLFVYFRVPEQKEAALQLAVPKAMQLKCCALSPADAPVIQYSAGELGNELIYQIKLDPALTAGRRYEMQVEMSIDTFPSNQYLSIEAQLVTGAEISEKAFLRLAVYGKAKSLQYLPEIYDGDDFMSRFLMLFESFWKPVQQQIEQIEAYFDAGLTPPDFLPWLLSWFGIPVDPSLPPERLREMLRSAMSLSRGRGTRQAIEDFLKMYTGAEVTIVEHSAANFVLGNSALLGPQIALGRHNLSNTVQIKLKVPKAELERTKDTLETYRQKMVELVRTMIPAYVSFDVICMLKENEGAPPNGSKS